MCLGCLVAALGLSYESEEAQEFIQQAIGTDGSYSPQVYGAIIATYKESEEEYSHDCESCGGEGDYDQESDFSNVEYAEPILNY